MPIEGPLRVALATAGGAGEPPGWHARRLEDAFAARGCETRRVALPDCRFDLAAGPAPLLPGFEDGPPHGVFVRHVPNGSFQQVVFYLDVLSALERLGAQVYNSAPAIERSVDKLMTGVLLKAAGLPTPDTWVCADAAHARAVIAARLARGRAVAIKPLFGSQGRGLRLARPGEALPELDDKRDDERDAAGGGAAGGEGREGVYYLQDFIGGENTLDVRIFVIAGRAVAAMRRHAQGWIKNVAQGAKCLPWRMDARAARLAEAAARAVGLAYAGVDLMRDAHGAWRLLELNGVPAWRGVQSVVDVDLAGALADDFLRRCRGRAPRAAAVG